MPPLVFQDDVQDDSKLSQHFWYDANQRNENPDYVIHPSSYHLVHE